MAILESDIKILKSAVMADTSDGGGAMTGVEVVDGLSNAMFPDTSKMNRALGNVAMRELYGVAHTDNTDSLLGAHVIITDAPDDPLVHCTLMRTSGWADTRAVAQDSIEKYLVKGPRLTYRLWDTHYAGSLILKLICMVTATPPAGGDAIVLRNVNGQEQYVRILRVSTTSQQVAVVEGNGTVIVNAQVATCEIGNPLDYDFAGPPALRVGLNEALYAQVFSCNIASGARFYGIKPLAAPAALGDYSVMALGGIYTPIVPAATVESPLIDLYPLTDRTGIVATSIAPVALDSFTVRLSAARVLTLPTPIAPGTLSLAGGGNTFTDSGGDLKAGTLVVGTVDYKAGTLTFSGTSPDYGTVSCALTYQPATVAQMANYSASMAVTLANQGRAYVNAFEPPPAPGSFTLSYMAQGRWYDLRDNGAGKLSGAESSYGVGTLDSTTGSMGVTLGAIPDIGSLLIADYGDKAAATSVDPSRLPLRLGARLLLPPGVSYPVTMTWGRGDTVYTATLGADGQVTGDATGHAGGGVVIFEPSVFPEGLVSMSGIQYETHVNTINTPVTNTNPYQYQSDAAILPIGRGTLSGKLAVTTPPNAVYPVSQMDVFDRSGQVYARYHGNKEDGIANNGGEIKVGSINYDTGLITLMAEAPIYMWFDEDAAPSGSWAIETYKRRKLVLTQFTIAPYGALTAPAYSAGTTTTYNTTYETVSTQTPVSNAETATTWTAAIYTAGLPLLMSNMAFSIGSDNYSVAAGILRRGWDAVTGLPLSASAGTLNSEGAVTVSTLPSNFVNSITWANAVQDASPKFVGGGVFRTASAPLKAGVMQLQSGTHIASANDEGGLSGGGFTGTVDFQRGTVKWQTSQAVPAASLSYNAVFLQYLPLDRTLLGIDTVRLPLDGRVPIYRPGDIQVIHNTQTYALPNPLVKGVVYSVGRSRVAAMKGKTATGMTVDTTKYTTDLDAGTIVFPADADLTGLLQPFAVEHRIEDMLVCSVADISGKLTFTSRLTHEFPAGTSFVSSALAFGDLFARAYNPIEQATWTGKWSDTLIGEAPTANFNEVIAPLTTTNRGAIAEQWALIFAGSTTTFRIIGRSVGEIGTGNTATDCAPINPATGVPYFTVPALGWGTGWVPGNVYRFNTAACGAPFWTIRTVLQGPATLQDDKFTLAFRTDVDRP